MPQHVHQRAVPGQRVDEGLFDRCDLLGAGPAGSNGDTQGGVDVGEGVGGSPPERAAHGQRRDQRYGLAEVDQPVQ